MNSLELVGGSQHSGVPSQGLGDHEIKHLELVQSVICRMAQHSFQLKGCSVTVATAIFAFAAKESSPSLAILALFPAAGFWCLDAYYLRQERLYRRLYEAIADPLKTVRPFSMTTEEYTGEVESWEKTLVAKTIFPLHTGIVLIMLVEIAAFLITVWITNFLTLR
jgi:hypothetical protein